MIIRRDAQGRSVSVPLEERFWRLTTKTGGCWIWSGRCFGNGYGQIRDGERRRLAHRVSWEIHVGPIPENLNVLHRCDNRPCVRPDHLFVGTAQDNVTDMINKGRQSVGEDHPNSKLTEVEVVALLNDQKEGMSYSALSRKYAVSRMVAHRICAGKIWKHVERVGDVEEDGGLLATERVERGRAKLDLAPAVTGLPLCRVTGCRYSGTNYGTFCSGHHDALPDVLIERLRNSAPITHERRNALDACLEHLNVITPNLRHGHNNGVPIPGTKLPVTTGTNLCYANGCVHKATNFNSFCNSHYSDLPDRLADQLRETDPGTSQRITVLNDCVAYFDLAGVYKNGAA